VTTKPELKLGGHMAPGLAAVALFVVMAAVFMTAGFGASQGFDREVANVSVTENPDANVGFQEVDGQTRAVVRANGSVEDRVTLVNATGYETSTVRTNGQTYAVAEATITKSIGYAMFNIEKPAVASEGFLVAFEIIDLVLVAALVGGVMLARRELEGEVVTALRSDDDVDTATEDPDGGAGPTVAPDGGED
jgi:hypothetical protein